MKKSNLNFLKKKYHNKWENACIWQLKVQQLLMYLQTKPNEQMRSFLLNNKRKIAVVIFK